MTAPPVLLFVALCFGAGWGLDAWLGGGSEEEHAARPRIPAMKAKAGETSTYLTQNPSFEKQAIPSAKTLDELLRLITGVPYATGRARAEIAIGQLTEAELSAACGELEKRVVSNGAPRFPAQVKEPLLQRWLAVNPQAALRLCLGFGIWDGRKTEDIIKKAVSKEAREHPEFIATMNARSFHRISWNECCVRAVWDLPPGEALSRLLAMGACRGGDEEPFSWGYLPDWWIAEAPHKAMTWALSLPPGTARDRLLSTMASRWAEKHREEALAFIDALASPGMRRYLTEAATEEEFVPGIRLQ